jgi:hypothetical protein
MVSEMMKDSDIKLHGTIKQTVQLQDLLAQKCQLIKVAPT